VCLFPVLFLIVTSQYVNVWNELISVRYLHLGTAKICPVTVGHSTRLLCWWNWLPSRCTEKSLNVWERRYYYIQLACNIVLPGTSAVTVSIFGFAVGFGRFLDKNRGSGTVFIGSDLNHVQSRDRTIIGSVSYRNRYWVYRIESYQLLLYRGKPTLRASLQIPQLISDNRLHYTGSSKDIRAPSPPRAPATR